MKKLFVLLLTITAFLAYSQTSATNTLEITPDNTVTVNGDLNVSLDTTLSGNLVVDKETDITGNLSVSGDITSPTIEDLKKLIDLLIPVGSVNAYTGIADPEGWLICDGRKISRTQDGGKYARLVDFLRAVAAQSGEHTEEHPFVIKRYMSGTTEVVLTTTLYEAFLPDFRGMFLRGMNNPNGTGSINRDPDDEARKSGLSSNCAVIGGVMGSVEWDAFQKHTHVFANGPVPGQGHLHYTSTALIGYNNYVGGSWTEIGDPSASANGGTLRATTETRPKNIYVNYIIRY